MQCFPPIDKKSANNENLVSNDDNSAPGDAPGLHESLPSLIRNITRVIWSAGMLHRTKTSFMLRNLLNIFVITNCILSLGHVASSLLNASRVNWIALVELWKFLFRLKLGAFSIATLGIRGWISVVDIYVAAFHC